MRIIAGQHRGLTLASVGKGDEAAHLRPTSDRVRESLFNVLMSYSLPHGSRVLDLFSGTGALGLEALSRGAEHVTFVDNGRVSQKLIRENIAKTRREDDTTLLMCAANKLPMTSAPCDLVFLDPPYGKSLGAAAILLAQKNGWLADDALIVFEENTPQAVAGFEQVDLRRYGDTHITIMRAQ
ncbi:16S rRNA (guanine(966)-N(2))-methyltransferase RsmD [Octadecabacter sp. 1_MG-2023]|uniref:16S rRNA (guanine(966)-N(2))-methyltransferase RsmD n=1 Tax=unclassified Octadecabacter TaxID=196158 RepID=UPI001C091619|nr:MULTISPECIES: 16S rRNA (guanine(966)-N(2))-methyltransferase RsmD [unclassified Octadecabacter]MBU2992537.1 16S rRNA (guanine(966)-N(2))-methyltransferase RsmD [Octadecabacter sp. B2R22]MDO6734706.1 16S rRNA (guanine(966)-N(2))-methyltransferase RsmD [Octadecabacter sp. 1_MG-2023]